LLQHPFGGMPRRGIPVTALGVDEAFELLPSAVGDLCPTAVITLS